LRPQCHREELEAVTNLDWAVGGGVLGVGLGVEVVRDSEREKINPENPAPVRD